MNREFDTWSGPKEFYRDEWLPVPVMGAVRLLVGSIGLFLLGAAIVCAMGGLW